MHAAANVPSRPTLRRRLDTACASSFDMWRQSRKKWRAEQKLGGEDEGQLRSLKIYSYPDLDADTRSPLVAPEIGNMRFGYCSLSANTASDDSSEDHARDGDSNAADSDVEIDSKPEPKGPLGSAGNPWTLPPTPEATADFLAAFGASDKPITEAHLPPTPPRQRREVIEIPDSPTRTGSSSTGHGRYSPSSPSSHQGSTLPRSGSEGRILDAIIRVELPPTIHAAVAKAAADAIFGLNDDYLRALGSQQEEDASVRRCGTDAGVAKLRELAPDVPFAARIDRPELYVGEVRMPPQLAHVKLDHSCGLCGLVLSHPVRHIYCFVCFRKHLNDSWDCPRPDCRATQFRPPFPAPHLEAVIESTYVGFMDFTVVTMTWQDVRFPSAR
ncbi:hypothetical protein C8F01DRAFT_1092089 [Mycena amicta]|nr:hypothetical protein C8F01DRAFT_1092089 [Mycena amicta]